MSLSESQPVGAAVRRWMLAVAVAGVFALASIMLLPGTASSQTADQITLTAVEVTTGARDVEAARGDTVTMTIRASGAEAMQGLQFTLEYNPSVVEVVDASVAESQPGALFAANTATPSEIVVVFVVQAPVGVTEVDIANVTFRVVGELGASTSLSFTAIAAADGSAPSQAISVTAVSGSIMVMSQAPQAEVTPTVIPVSTPLPVPTDVPTAVPTTQALAAGSTQTQPEPTPTPAPLAAQVAGAPQRPVSGSIPGPGAAAPAPSAAQVQAQASQAGSEPAAAAPPPAEPQPQGGMGCTAPLLGSSPSKSGLGDLMLLGTVVGSLLISSRFRRRR